MNYLVESQPWADGMDGTHLLLHPDDDQIETTQLTDDLAKAGPANDDEWIQSIEAAIAGHVSNAFDWLRRVVSNDPARFPVAELEGRLGRSLAPLREVFGVSMSRVSNDNLVTPPTEDHRLAVSFNARNSYTDAFMESYPMATIRNITDEQGLLVQQIVHNSSLQGTTPAQLARQIRDVVGLTPLQGEQVANYRYELENLSSKSLGRALRDKRYDTTVMRAIESKTPLSSDKIDQMVAAYRRRYIQFRAMTIARTESLRAASFGGRAAMQAAIDSGDIIDSQVERSWMSAHDNRVRHSHHELDGLKVIGMETPYQIPTGGTIRWPHDPEAPASEVINCRCTETYRILPKSQQ